MSIAQSIVRHEIAEALRARTGEPLDYRKLEAVESPDCHALYWGGGLTVRVRLVREYEDGNHVYRADLYVDDLDIEAQPVHGRTGLVEVTTLRGAKALAKEVFQAYKLKLPPKAKCVKAVAS